MSAPPPTLQVAPPHPARMDPEQLLTQCELQRGRVSGPGGQNRNKVETAVFLRHRPTGVTATGTERRSQQMNLRQAVFRLRVALAIEVRTPPPENFEPSELWRSRVQAGKPTLITGMPTPTGSIRTPGKPQISVSAAHADFPAILSEALDYVAALKMDPPRAARAMGVSPSQMIKLLKQEPKALAWVNQRRRALGMHELK